jgi:hypothetical protein
MRQQILVNSPISNFMKNCSVVVDLLYMEDSVKLTCALLKLLSSKGAKNEIALKIDISVPKRRVKNSRK